MTLQDAIYIRRSIRTYVDDNLPDPQRNLLVDKIEELNQLSDLKMKLFENDRRALGNLAHSLGFFVGANHYIAFYSKKQMPHYKELSGYFGEILALYAVTIGLGTCFVGGTFDREYINRAFAEDEECKLILLIGEAKEKQSLRSKIISGVLHRKTKHLEAFIESDDSIPEWMERGLKAISAAPSGKNRQDAYIRYESGSVSMYLRNPESFVRADLGTAKANFEIETGLGHFELGDGGCFIFNKEKDK